MVLVCCTLFPALLCSLALFAIHKNSLVRSNQALFVAPVFACADRVTVCPFNQTSKELGNLQRLDLTQSKEALYHDSDIPRLKALQCFKLSGQFRTCAILQLLSSAVKMGCIRRFFALNTLYRYPILCEYAYML